MRLFVFLLLFNFSYSIAQVVVVKAANSDGKAALFSLSGEKSSFIDSIPAKSNYSYLFNLSSKHSGFYRLVFNNNKWLDFVFDNEDIKLETDANNVLDSLIIIESKSNKIYYEFIRYSKEYKTKSELLTLILNEYPREEEYKKLTKKTLAQTQMEYWNYVNIIAPSNVNSFTARYIRTIRQPIINPDIPKGEYLNVLKTYALLYVDFSDDALIYSDAFTNKTIEYLSYYRNPQLPMPLLEKEFEIAIDSILNKAKVNDIVYKHIVEYLLDGFKKYGFDNVINYIIDNYVIKDEICLDEKPGATLERRIQQSKILKIGSTVPNIALPDLTGKIIELIDLNSENTLIIFYTSRCPHCKEILPKIYEQYQNQRTKVFEVLAVSLDTSINEWKQFISENKFEWLNVSELSGWDGKSASDYFVYATPTMFIVDKNKLILSKPLTLEELKKSL